MEFRDERRFAKRVPTEIRGLFLNGVWREHAHIHDISVSGMRIEGAGDAPIGSAMRVSIPDVLPDATRLELAGTVVRGTQTGGFALCFQKHSDALAVLISRLLAKRPTPVGPLRTAARASTPGPGRSWVLAGFESGLHWGALALIGVAYVCVLLMSL